MNEYIKSDLYRYTGKTDFFSFCRLYFNMKSPFRFQVAHRLVNSKENIEHLLGIILWATNRQKRLIQISRKTQIGYGLYIGHLSPIYINPNAIIGNNCNLSQLTNIGSNQNNAAIIGDCVYIGPSCCIIENVKIGNNATIGAGSIVTKDIPANATAVGNYAKVINYNNPGRFIKNKWKKVKEC